MSRMTDICAPAAERHKKRRRSAPGIVLTVRRTAKCAMPGISMRRSTAACGNFYNEPSSIGKKAVRCFGSEKGRLRVPSSQEVFASAAGAGVVGIAVTTAVVIAPAVIAAAASATEQDQDNDQDQPHTRAVIVVPHFLFTSLV